MRKTKRPARRRANGQFPYGGAQTLRMIDDLLADCGVMVLGGADGPAVQCATGRRYLRLRDQALRVLLFENAQRRKAGAL